MSTPAPTPRSPRAEALACDAALFGLDPDERAELEALALDADWQLDLELAAGEISAQAYSSHPAEALPPGLHDKLLAAADRHVPAAPQPAAAEPPAARVLPFPARNTASPEITPPAPRRTWVPWLLAAAAILLALLGWLRDTRDRVSVPVPAPTPSPSDTAPAPSTSVVRDDTPASARDSLLAVAGTQKAPWTATKDPGATGASGDVIWHNGVQRGYMRFTGLAPNDPSKTQYQLWIFDGERDERYPVDGGVFDVGPEGEAVVPIAAKLHVNKPTLFAITIEKPGGVVVSAREHIVLTASLPPT
ncbi:MAG: anti-sigma factor [Polyangiaceae bacterium]